MGENVFLIGYDSNAHLQSETGRRRHVPRIEFYKREGEASLLDPKEGFTEKTMAFEVRRDPLTGHLSRILPFRRKLPENEISPDILDRSRNGCPFCRDQMATATPQLTREIAPEGRLERGEACLFPNAFPYARHNWVVVLSKSHFLSADQFTVDILKDGFSLAQEGIRRLEKKDATFRYPSINWNYLPQAGAGLYHPHLQVVVEDAPTTSHRRVLEALGAYRERTGSFFWEDFLEEERGRNERYVGRRGNVHFLTAFSPAGSWGEAQVLFSGRPTVGDVTIDDWTHFSEGLAAILRYLRSKALDSFNLAIFSGGEDQARGWVYARLCPRMPFPPWGTSDVNYFEKLHGEVFCLIPPEKMCEELRPFFVTK